MARGYSSRQGGFAEGFAGGFGLMNDFYDSKRKQDLAEEEMGISRDYYKTRGEAAKRSAEAEVTRAGNEAIRLGNEELRLKNQGLVAENESDRIARAVAQDQQKINPETGLLYSVEASIAQRNLADTTSAKQERELLNGRNASHLTNMSAYAKALDREGLAAYIEANKEDIFDDRSFLSAMALHDPRRPGFHASIAEDIKSIANGELNNPDFEMSKESIAGFSAVFRRGANDYVGKTVDDSFPNAPESLHGGVVTDSFLSDIKSSANGVTGDVSVEVTMPNGDIQYYTAPMTKNASELESELIAISTDEGIMSIAAIQGAIDFLKEDSAIQNELEKAYMTQKFGSPEKFQTRVTSETNAIVNYMTKNPVTGGTTVGDIDYLSEKGFKPSMKVPELMKNEAMIRDKVSENLLYGMSPVSKKREADQFLSSIKSALPNVRYAETIENAATGISSRVKGRTSAGGSGLLSNLIEGGFENLTTNQVIDLNNMMNQSNDREWDKTLRGDELEQIKAYLKRHGKLAGAKRETRILSPGTF